MFVVSNHTNCIDGFFDNSQKVTRLPAAGQGGSYNFHRSHRDECDGKQAVFGLAVKSANEDAGTATNRYPDVVFSCDHRGACLVLNSNSGAF